MQEEAPEDGAVPVLTHRDVRVREVRPRSSDVGHIPEGEEQRRPYPDQATYPQTPRRL
jgi:hypothetical protein